MQIFQNFRIFFFDMQMSVSGLRCKIGVNLNLIQ